MARPGFFAWYEWRHGIGRYKGKTPRDPKLRPKGLSRLIPPAWWVRNLKLWHGDRPPPKPTPAPKPKPKPFFTMYDSVNVSEIPRNAVAVAGYVGGRWPTFPSLVRLFPRSKRLSIAIAASEDAMCLDIESRDATPAQAAPWIRRQHGRGQKCPIVYTSLAFAQSLVDHLTRTGLVYGRDYKLWCAHYTFARHICSPKCGLGLRVTAHATQYTDKALGRNLDASWCSPGFLG